MDNNLSKQMATESQFEPNSSGFRLKKITLDNVLNLIAILVLLILGLRAISTVDTSWDSLAYHLPFAGRLVGILRPEELLLSLRIEQYYLGFPLLAEFLQGLMWFLTGRLASTNLASLFCLVILIIVTVRRLKLEFWKVSLVLLSVPLIQIHSVLSYIDLIGGCLITISLVNLLSSIENNNFSLKEFVYCALPLALAANVKYNLTILALPGLFLVIIFFFFKNNKRSDNRLRGRRWAFLFGLLSVLFVIISTWYMVRNTILFANPVYPLGVSVGNVEVEAGEYSPYKYSLVNTLAPKKLLRYLYSISELGLWTQKGTSVWSVDMSNGISNPADEPFFKLGGFFIGNLILWFIVLIIATKETKAKLLSRLLIAVIIMFIGIGFMPSSDYLRYWMFLPMILGITMLFFMRKAGWMGRSIGAMVLLLQFAIFVNVAYQNRTYFKPLPLSSEQELINQYDLPEGSTGLCVTDLPPRGILFERANPDLAIQSINPMDSCIYPVYQN